MKDINEAYDALTKKRSSTGPGPGAGGYGYSGQASGGGYQTTPEFAKIRQIINSGDLDAADRMLEGIADRGAEWYFLRGNIAQRRGWMDEAHRNYQTACQMAPGNIEYRQALSMVQYGGNRQYQSGNYRSGDCSDDACSICQMMMCMNCLCGNCH